MNYPPTYFQQLREHVKGRSGEVVHVEIRHDDGCGIFENRSCNCEPEMESGARVDRKYGA